MASNEKSAWVMVLALGLGMGFYVSMVTATGPDGARLAEPGSTGGEHHELGGEIEAGQIMEPKNTVELTTALVDKRKGKAGELGSLIHHQPMSGKVNNLSLFQHLEELILRGFLF